MATRAGWLTGAAGLALLAGCHAKQPSGQVAATVGGQEITLQEVNTELENTTLPPKADKDQVQRVLLQRIIERKLIDGIAEQKELDKSPDFLAQKRRADEILLAQTYAKQVLASVPLPSDGDIRTFMASNPGSFSAREQLVLDQIRFPTPSSPQQLKGIEGTHSLDAVAAFLRSKGIKFERSPAGLDSATLPQGMLSQINGLPANEPFVVPTGGILTVNVISGRRPIANDPAQARAAAVAAWRQQRVQQRISGEIEQARTAAKITYQKGFEPAPKPSGAPASAMPPSAAAGAPK